MSVQKLECEEKNNIECLASLRKKSKMSPAVNKQSKVTVILGAQWGDEGKGKVVDMLASDVDIVCRCQGGSNAGHTVVVQGVKYYFHLLPSGIINTRCKSVIGNGVVIHLPDLFKELEQIEARGCKDWKERLIISDKAHLVFDFHQKVDQFQELGKGARSLGTTKKGIGPAYENKVARIGVRMSELLHDYDKFSEKFKLLVSLHQAMYPMLKVDVQKELEKYKEYADRIRPHVRETIHYLHDALKLGKRILVEGANAALLDLDFGTYPYVTSSNCSIGGVCTGLGIPPFAIGETIAVVKAYTTRVGSGPFPTELLDATGQLLQERGAEFGTTTKRRRRCGWLDLALLKFTTIVNGYTSIFLTKLDILDTLSVIKVCTAYYLNDEEIDYFPSGTEDLEKVEPIYETLEGWQCCTENIRSFDSLPLNAQKYVRILEKHLNIPVKWIGVGADRENIIIT